jgi:hypothetical protein
LSPGLQSFDFAQDGELVEPFIAYAQECSLTYANLFAEIIIGHLKKCKVDLIPPKAGQTDNGSEFIGAWSAKEPSVSRSYRDS